MNFADRIKKRILMKLFEGRGRLTSNKRFNFRADRDHNPAPGFLTKSVRLRDTGNCKIFTESAASVCRLRAFVECGPLRWRPSYRCPFGRYGEKFAHLCRNVCMPFIASFSRDEQNAKLRGRVTKIRPVSRGPMNRRSGLCVDSGRHRHV